MGGSSSRLLAVLFCTWACCPGSSLAAEALEGPHASEQLGASVQGFKSIEAEGDQRGGEQKAVVFEEEEQDGVLMEEPEGEEVFSSTQPDDTGAQDLVTPFSTSGPQIRRLKGSGGKKKRGGDGWGNLLFLLGTLLTGAAAWRKTSELYHSPRQALRKAKMHLMGQVPSSWDEYVRGLPVLDEVEFPELRPLLRRLERKPVVLMSLPRPRPRLSAFLGLTDAQRSEGIVIKGKSTSGCTSKEVAFELFAHENLAKGLPLTLPSLGAYRDYDATTVYLITPRARADVSLYTRRMPDKVNIQLAFAEMVYGLWGMHKRGWVHRDIKGCNYFVSQSGHALLADFEGFWRNRMHAIMYGEEVEIIFTQHYVSPELTFDGEYQVFDTKSDVYALGKSFEEMLEWVGDVPVPRKDLALDMLSHMLEADPKKRYDLKQCMRHPYFEGIDFDQLDKFPYGKAFEGNYITPYKFL
ncbi:hypothetical protein ACSSS7_003068 [Eimeria intestinalis]